MLTVHTLLHGSGRWKCGSEIHRHEGIVLICKSCQSEQLSRLDTELTRTQQCRATARAPESVAGRGNHSRVGFLKGGGLKVSRFFFTLPPQFSFFLPLLWVFSWNFGGV